jgi:hypothetical protein
MANSRAALEQPAFGIIFPVHQSVQTFLTFLCGGWMAWQ